MRSIQIFVVGAVTLGTSISVKPGDVFFFLCAIVNTSLLRGSPTFSNLYRACNPAV